LKKNKTIRTYFGLRFIATGSETNGKYFLSETTIPAGDPGPPIHSHSNEVESFFLKSGQLNFNVNGEAIELNQGGFLVIEKGKRHTWRNDSGVDAELIITFAPAGIENMFMELEENMNQIREIGMKYGTDFEI
jgi:quercetin dioxygenase-like cupin family protein